MTITSAAASASRWVKLWKSVPLPTLQQGSTLKIRTKLPPALASSPSSLQVVFQPQWRDDGRLRLTQTIPSTSSSNNNNDTKEWEADMTISAGCANEADENDDIMAKETSQTISVSVDWNNQALAGDEPTMPPPPTMDSHKGAQTHVGPPRWILRATVPEKINVDCRLEGGGGDISVRGKLEGSDGFTFSTSCGNMSFTKLRGHAIDLQTTRAEDVVDNGGGSIFVSQLLEAQNLHVSVQRGRIRAKRMNASHIRVHAKETEDEEDEEENKKNASAVKNHGEYNDDDDDAGALVDIGSLYASKSGTGAWVTTTTTTTPKSSSTKASAVRIKSHHGHVDVETTTTRPTGTPPLYDAHGCRIPVVDLGGVNGSCQVVLRESSSCPQTHVGKSNHCPSESPLAARVHVDSLAPDTVTNIFADAGGDVELTLDRKVEADVRLVVAQNVKEEILHGLLLDEEEEEDANHVWTTLRNEADRLRHCGKTTNDTDKSFIQIDTPAFVEEEKEKSHESLQFVQGRLENQSREPPSRFDVQTKGVGKIAVETAARHALDGFVSSSSLGAAAAHENPLLVAITRRGKMTLETTSWLGAIAKRYGLNQQQVQRSPEELGRRAVLNLKPETQPQPQQQQQRQEPTKEKDPSPQ